MIALAVLLLAAGPGESVADAERAFAASAQANGQWAAFRAAAAPDAILYAPGPVNAQRFLAGRADRPATMAWRPAHTITSCDGTLAYSTGPWTRSDGASGSFGTVWMQTGEGWRWVYDGGREGGASFGVGLTEDRSACGNPSGTAPGEVVSGGQQSIAALAGGALAGVITASDGPMPAMLDLAPGSAEGVSADRTLRWRINPVTGGKTGAHLLRMWSWDGRRYRLAVLDYSSGG